MAEQTTQTGGQPTTADPGQEIQVPSAEPGVEYTSQQWESKYHGLRGSFIQAQRQWEERRGMLEQQIATLQQQVQSLQAQTQQLQQERDQLKQQVEALPTLEERASFADALEVQVERLELLVRYPEIWGQVEVVEVEDEETGEKREERRNPFLDMILSSTLDGDEFEQMVNDLAAKLRAGQTPTQSSQPATETAGTPQATTGGMPPTPAPPQDIESLRQQALDAQLAGDYDKAWKLWEELAKLKTQQAQ